MNSKLMGWRPATNVKVLQARAQMLADVRHYFSERNVLEVETPILGAASITDPHLHAFNLRQWFLQTSPEYFMKRLLADGAGDIYQVARVFRDEESGRNHHHEFSLLEWYRHGFDQHQLANEVIDLIQGLYRGNDLKVVRESYAEVFDALDLNVFTATSAEYESCAVASGIEVQGSLLEADWRELIFSELIQNHFPPQQLTIVHSYLAEDAALARINPLDARVADRFEIFWGELELANGFHELQDANEQAQRFEQDNVMRRQAGLQAVDLDQKFLGALEAGLPDCAGVAIGLDRLLMRLTGNSSLDQVIAFLE